VSGRGGVENRREVCSCKGRESGKSERGSGESSGEGSSRERKKTCAHACRGCVSFYGGIGDFNIIQCFDSLELSNHVEESGGVVGSSYVTGV